MRESQFDELCVLGQIAETWALCIGSKYLLLRFITAIM